MRRYPSLLCAILSQLAVHVFAHASPPGFQYISPIPGSTFVSRETNIIIRQGDLIDRKSISDDAILVVGTHSGRHAGRFVLSDDSRTLVFVPSSGFADGENVNVTLREGTKTRSGASIPPLIFSFTITTTSRSVQIKPLLTTEIETEIEGTANHLEDPDQRESSVLDSIPQDFPRISVSLSDHPFPGYIFLSNLSFDPNAHFTPYLMALDSAAHPVFLQKVGGLSLDFKLQPNGLISYFDSPSGAYLEADTTFAEIDTFKCGNGYVTDFHEFRVLPNGHALLLGDDYETVRMDTIVAGGNPQAAVVGAIIQELDQAKNVIFQWRSWDHYRITDATHENLTAATIDYVHANALEIDNDGNILLSARHMDEITKINRQTGDIIWRLGGSNNEFTFVNDTLGFSHQHAIRRIANGDITLFDNGNFHNLPFSRAVEYQLDEQRRTASLVWQYRHTPDIYGGAMGYVQRLDNYNTLIGWGAANPSITEVRPDGSTALELSLPPGFFSYRAYLFPAVVLARLQPASYQLVQNYPNPFNPSTAIPYILPVESYVTLTVYNVLGQEIAQLVHEQQRAGHHEVVFNGNGLASGIYFYRLAGTGFTNVKKMLLLK